LDCYNDYICGKKNVMAQSLSKILLHAVWHIKTTSPEIQKEDRDELYGYMFGVLETIGCTPICINGVGNHVHLLFALSKTLSIASVVEKVKTSSNKWLKSRGRYYCDFSWQNGYGVFSVSESVSPVTKRYIERQEQHHAQIDFHDEYLQLLQNNNIPYDINHLFHD